MHLSRAAMLAASLLLVCVPAAPQTVILYSHVDIAEAQCVRSLVQTYDQVRTDADIRPGDPWRQTMAGWIMNARTVIVLWSAAAAASAEVAPEWRMALAAGARVVPMMLDATPLPPELAARQAVNVFAAERCALLPPCLCPPLTRTMAPP